MSNEGHGTGGLTDNRIVALDSRGWLAETSLSAEQVEAAERVRVQVFIVNRRTMWYRELIPALLGHARAWLCDGGIDVLGQA